MTLDPLADGLPGLKAGLHIAIVGNPMAEIFCPSALILLSYIVTISYINALHFYAF
jgi:hypothetical protein